MFNILRKYSSQYSKSIIFSCWPLSIHFFKIHSSVTFHHTIMVVIFWKNNFDIYFPGSDFAIVTGDGNTNYIALLIVSRFSTQIQLNISVLLIAVGKPVRNTYLGIVKHDWTSVVCWRANRKPFLSARGNIWNSKVAFYNNIPPACWGADVSIEMYELLLLFSIISPWRM